MTQLPWVRGAPFGSCARPNVRTQVVWNLEKENYLWDSIAKSRATENGITDCAWHSISLADNEYLISILQGRCWRAG
jgi:hypothetical protein